MWLPHPQKIYNVVRKKCQALGKKKEQCVVFFLNKLTKKEMIKNQVNNADN